MKEKKEPYAVVTLEFYGNTFIAEKVEEAMGIECISRTILGDEQEIGRYKGAASLFGSATFEAPEQFLEGQKTLWLLRKLDRCIGKIRALRVETIHLRVDLFYGKHQCNWELSHEEIGLLYKLKVNYLYSVC